MGEETLGDVSGMHRALLTIGGARAYRLRETETQSEIRIVLGDFRFGGVRCRWI
jgi:hypothetical protein